MLLRINMTMYVKMLMLKLRLRLLLIVFLLLTGDNNTVPVAKHELKWKRETGGSNVVWSRGSIYAISPLESPRPFSKRQTHQ